MCQSKQMSFSEFEQVNTDNTDSAFEDSVERIDLITWWTELVSKL